MSDNKFRFTESSLNKLVNPQNRTRHYDLLMPGLVLDQTVNGSKTFRVYKKIPGNRTPVSVTLGAFPALGLEPARKLARKVMADIADGINPNDSKRQFRASAVTLREVYQVYKLTRELKPITLRGYDQLMKCYLHDWQDKRLADINEEMVLKRHNELTARSPAQADYAMRTLRALFNFAKSEYKSSDRRPLFPFNPVAVLSEKRVWNNVSRKQTRLRPSEFVSFFSTLENLRTEAINFREDFSVAVYDFVEFMTYTGLRKTELLELKWCDVFDKDSLFWLRDTKNHDDVELPLTEPLKAIIERRKHFKVSDYVFGAENAYGRVIEPKKVIKRINLESGLTFTLHDLRRTYCSIAESIGIGGYTIKRLLNHKTNRSDVTAGYTVLTAEELRQPALKIVNRIQQYGGLLDPDCNSDLDSVKHMLVHLNKSQKLELMTALIS